MGDDKVYDLKDKEVADSTVTKVVQPEVKEEKSSMQKKPTAKKQVQKHNEEKQKEEAKMDVTSGALLFGKYSYNVEVTDQSLQNYIFLQQMEYPMSFRRDSQMKFSKANINIVERLINALMRGGTGGKIGGKVIRTEGRLQGKKLKLMRIVDEAFGIVASKTNKNPIQVLVDALENSAPIEDTTRIRYGGINYNVAVGISASRRLDVALRNLALAALISAFKNRKTLKEALAEELILAANKDSNSYAIKRKVEMEHIARSAR